MYIFVCGKTCLVADCRYTKRKTKLLNGRMASLQMVMSRIGHILI